MRKKLLCLAGGLISAAVLLAGQTALTVRAGNNTPILGEVAENVCADIRSYPIEITGDANTDFSVYRTYYSKTPEVISFFDYKGYYNVAYVDDGKLKIQRYTSDMQLVDKIQIPKKYPLFGNVTCDSSGNYYVVWGQADTDVTNCVTISVAKYDYNGNEIAVCEYKGYETWDAVWGTRKPFDAGNCSVIINQGVLAVNYARQMYSEHQSNYIIYIDCASMTKLKGENAYCSHSFDQRIVATSDGGYLALNHGDAYDRSFGITKIGANRAGMGEIWNFHFREGANRDHGYNETYAQLGGIVETENSYIFCGSSERTLSLDTAPTNISYCGHSEARNLFVQILKKDFYAYNGADQYRVAGETRIPTGSKPDATETSLWLNGTERDYGVLWLTDYSDDYYVTNPKIVAISGNSYAVMWEKRAYDHVNKVESYYAVLDEYGNIIVQPMRILGAKLAGNIDPVYRDGKIYWTTSDAKGAYVHCLSPMGVPQEWIKVTNISIPEKLYIKSKETVNLNAVVSPANATCKGLIYESSSPLSVKVDKDGNVTTDYRTGCTVTVTSEDGNAVAKCEIIVMDFYLSKTEIEMQAGDEWIIYSYLTLSNGTYDDSVDLSVSDESVISVQNYETMGIRIEAKKQGTSVITVKDRQNLGLTVSCVVNVTSREYEIKFDVNGGDALDASVKKVYYGEKYGELPTPTRYGYSFDGWYTMFGANRVTADTVCDGSAWLCAHWKKDDSNGDADEDKDKDYTLSTDGIYLMSADSNGFVAGLTTNVSSQVELEYRWTAYRTEDQKTIVVQDWTSDDCWLNWKPEEYGEYTLTAEARIKAAPSKCVSAQTEAVRYTPYIKGKCQMPYTGEGGGYLIGIETYDNPNQSYTYEMLILDCTLLAEGKDAWIYTTGRCGVAEGNALWTIWQPQYGYYWTLFRVYDANGVMIDQDCYGFVNTY